MGGSLTYFNSVQVLLQLLIRHPEKEDCNSVQYSVYSCHLLYSIFHGTLIKQSVRCSQYWRLRWACRRRRYSMSRKGTKSHPTALNMDPGIDDHPRFGSKRATGSEKELSIHRILKLARKMFITIPQYVKLIWRSEYYISNTQCIKKTSLYFTA